MSKHTKWKVKKLGKYLRQDKGLIFLINKLYLKIAKRSFKKSKLYI